MSSSRALNSVVDRLGHAPYHMSVLILGVNKSPSRSQFMEGKKRHYSMHTSLFLYVGNFILFCKLCHYIM